jgi:alpha-L-fucosidase 2
MGGPLSLRGQVFRKGLGTHSRCEIEYEIDERFRRFEALVGIDDDTAGQGSVVFRVLLDGREVWQTGPVSGQAAPKKVEVDTSDAKRLTLVVDFGSLGDVQDHADWAEARLVE